MPEALAATAIVLSLVALVVAVGAAKAAAKAAGTAPVGGGARRGEGVLRDTSGPADTLSPAMPATDPSVLVRLDALESRHATLELRAAAAAGAAPPEARREREGEPEAAPRRSHPMFP